MMHWKIKDVTQYEKKCHLHQSDNAGGKMQTFLSNIGKTRLMKSADRTA